MTTSAPRPALVAVLIALAAALPSPRPAAAVEPAPPEPARPSEPTGLAVDPSETEVFIKWSPAEDGSRAASYEVMRGQTLAARTTSLVASDAGLSADSTYCYSVVAVDEAGRRSLPAGPVCARTLDVTPPSAPATPAASLRSPVEVALAWGAATDNVGVEGYELLRGDRVVRTLEGLAASDSGLAPGRRYCYAVRAFDRAGNRSEASPAVCIVTPDVTPPSTPAAVSAMPLPRQVSLAWTESSDDVGVAGYEVLSGGQVVLTASANGATPGGLAAGEHCFAVRAFDAAGNRSAPSAPVCSVVPDSTPPSVPADVLAGAPGETSVTLRWQPSVDDVGVTGYEVLREGRVVARSTGAAAGEEGLAPSREYCYRVQAHDAAGNRSEPSAPACVVTPDLTPPTVPSEPVARAASDRVVQLHWKESTDNVRVAGYELRRGGEVVARSEVPRAEEAGLAPARDYCYTVRAYDWAGNRSPDSSSVCARTPDLTPPSVPSGVLAAAVTPSRVALAWEPSQDDVGVAGYEVLRGEAVVAKGVRPEASESGLAATTEHCYRVRAYDAAGNVSEASPPVCARTPEPGTPTAPSFLRAEPAGPRTISLRWEPSPDPGVVYGVYGERGQRIGTTRFRSYRVAGLKPGERRCFQVAALDETGRASPMTWPACADVPTALPVSSR